jgi:hypothetical protein
VLEVREVRDGTRVDACAILLMLGEEGSGRSVEGRKSDGESDQIRGEMNGREAVASGIADSVAVVPFKLLYLVTYSSSNTGMNS